MLCRVVHKKRRPASLRPHFRKVKQATTYDCVGVRSAPAGQSPRWFNLAVAQFVNPSNAAVLSAPLAGATESRTHATAAETICQCRSRVHVGDQCRWIHFSSRSVPKSAKSISHTCARLVPHIAVSLHIAHTIPWQVGRLWKADFAGVRDAAERRWAIATAVSYSFHLCLRRSICLKCLRSSDSQFHSDLLHHLGRTETLEARHSVLSAIGCLKDVAQASASLQAPTHASLRRESGSARSRASGVGSGRSQNCHRSGGRPTSTLRIQVIVARPMGFRTARSGACMLCCPAKVLGKGRDGFSSTCAPWSEAYIHPTSACAHYVGKTDNLSVHHSGQSWADSTSVETTYGCSGNYVQSALPELNTSGLLQNGKQTGGSK